MFWVDETINEILNRQDKNYLITDYKTPSGKIHVGALRGVIIHDVIYRGLKEKNQAVEYWYGFDDFDPIDALSPELKETYAKYMGVPLCNAPSPKKGYDNFAHYFADDFVKVFAPLGVSAKIIWASEKYKQGTFNKAIEIVLDNAAKIRAIYKEVSGGERLEDWYPFQVVCPNCGKIGTTRVYNWNKKEVSFVCEPEMVEWAQGCGYKGKISPYNGNGKMHYKVEAAAKWFTYGTSIELAGKDHYTKGGSFYVASEIAKEVFKITPAYGYGYEWFLVGGKKMSTSKGIGASAQDIASILPPKILRFLMVRTRAKRTIDFDVQGDTIPLLYDEYDRCSQAYFSDPKSDLARSYYYSLIDQKSEQPQYLLRFIKVAYLIQMPHIDIIQYAENEKGAKLTAPEKEEVENRIIVARKWLDEFAPENIKFAIQEKLPDSAKELNEAQKKYLTEAANRLEKLPEWSGETIHSALHDVKNEQGISPKEAFAAIYRIFIDKDSGPQAGWFLGALDKDSVLKRLEEAKNV